MQAVIVVVVGVKIIQDVKKPNARLPDALRRPARVIGFSVTVPSAAGNRFSKWEGRSAA